MISKIIIFLEILSFFNMLQFCRNRITMVPEHCNTELYTGVSQVIDKRLTILSNNQKELQL